MSYEQNERVWDRVWDSPAIVVGVDQSSKLYDRYVVAQLLPNSKSLGRTALRDENQLCALIEVAMPADEAATVVLNDTGPELATKGCDRIRRQLDLLED